MDDKMARHRLMQDGADPNSMDCEVNPEYCTLGYGHFGPCPPPPSEPIRPAVPPSLDKNRGPEVPEKVEE